MDEVVTGRYVLYFALAWSVFVAVKALYEAYMTAKEEIRSEINKEQRDGHKRSHLAILIGIAFYSFYNIAAYLYFDSKVPDFATDDRTIGVFNLFFMNILWLFAISHFKHERKGNVGSTSWKEILKF